MEVKILNLRVRVVLQRYDIRNFRVFSNLRKFGCG